MKYIIERKQGHTYEPVQEVPSNLAAAKEFARRFAREEKKTFRVINDKNTLAAFCGCEGYHCGICETRKKKDTEAQSEYDKDFMGNIQYFWQEKGDVERFAGLNPQDFQRIDPECYQLWEAYKLAERNLSRYINTI